MRWRTTWIFALALVTLTGCPEEFGKEGRIQRAAHRDVMESLRKNCSEDEIQKYCPQGQEQSEDCLRACGG